MENAGYLHGVGIVSMDRLECPTTLVGLSRKEKRRIAALEARRNYLSVKLQDGAGARLQYEEAELSAIEWALEIIQAYFDLINIEDVEKL